MREVAKTGASSLTDCQIRPSRDIQTAWPTVSVATNPVEPPDTFQTTAFPKALPISTACQVTPSLEVRSPSTQLSPQAVVSSTASNPSGPAKTPRMTRGSLVCCWTPGPACQSTPSFE